MKREEIAGLALATRLPRSRIRRRVRRARARVAVKRALMKAAAIKRFGAPSLLKLHELPQPKLGPAEVLIALHAAGVGVWDTHLRKGMFGKGRLKFPLVHGADGAGVIAARGARARRFRIGDRVWAYNFNNPKGGFHAQYVAIKDRFVDRLPRRLSFLEAAAAAAPGLTALQGLEDHLRLRRGHTLLIFGATGAVGTLAIQFAKRLGARVVATASGAAGKNLAKRLGADAVIDIRNKRAFEELKKLAPRGIDGVLALAGGAVLERILKHVRPGGRVAFPQGIKPEPRSRRGLRLLAYNAVAGPREFAKLKRAVEKARLRVPIAAAFSLAQAAKAHARIERGHVLGRVVLRIRE
jgi:NADPH:quinone reductase